MSFSFWATTCGFLPLPFSRFFIYLLVLILVHLGTFKFTVSARGNDPLIWCCQGWSDDFSTSAGMSQVDTKECNGVCRGETFCTDSSNKDCASNWYCDRWASLGNKTNDDCTKPDPGKPCFCDSAFCNCPKVLRGKKTPVPTKPLKCCSSIKGAGGGDPVEECSRFILECNGDYPFFNYSEYGCAETERERLRESCYKFSLKDYGTKDHVGGSCRCKTKFCNCPLDKKPGGGSTTVWNCDRSIKLWSLFLILPNFMILSRSKMSL